MHKSFLKSLVLAVVTGLALTLSPSALAQIVSSGMTGYVRGSDGKALAGATVNANHVPTNTAFSAVTNSEGKFNFRGLPVGGPYTVSASVTGYTDASVADITTQLGTDIDVALTLKSEVVQLEKFVAKGTRNALDSGSSGAGTTLSSARLSAKPTSERSLADMISASPLVTLKVTSGDREESQITAVGQNNRFNSIQIDGARINDVFGLNGTGLAAFFNPLSLDTIEQLSVQISPYDVRQSGFTGASINAVTKSGTNEFHGTAYYYFRGDHLFGQVIQGPNRREQTLTGVKIYPKLQRTTYGGTFSGPIWKDKVFFFLNYENYESISAGRDIRFAPAAGVEQQILDRYKAYSTAAGKTIDWGNPVTAATSNTQVDKKYLGKIDWKIFPGQRLSARISKTKGQLPQFGNFAGNTSSNAGVSGGISTSSDGHFYSQIRDDLSKSIQLFSQWNPDFKTEIRYTINNDDQLTPVNTVAPMTYVFGVSGTDLLNGASVTNGTYIVGTEQFRHGNLINVDTQQMSATGDYFWKNFAFSFGAEREQSNFNNLFRQGSYGLVSFRTFADFLNDTTNVVIQRNYYDPNVRPAADISKFATTGVFVQAKWDVNPRLVVNFGVREEFQAEEIKPALNTAFVTATGFRNDGSLDGVKTFSPRFGFNWSLDDERATQVRGGFGHFLGRSPWVFFSNSFGNTGVGTFSRSNTDLVNPLPSTYSAYLRTEFDPANPIGTGTDNPTLRREVDFHDNGLKLPAAWRGNLALDHKLSFLDSVVSVDYVYTKIDSALRTTNENLKPLAGGLSLDGRKRFSGLPSALANALYPGYTFMYRVSNTSVGKSDYFTISWDRPMKDKWAFNLSYTRGHATEAQANGATTAGGQFNRNAVFNQNDVEEGRSDFEIKDRIQLNLTRQFEVIKKLRTTASLYYEGHSGSPYTWVFGGDLNGDGVSFNDRVAVPSSATDPRFDFSGMTSAQQTAFFAYLDKSGLSKYAGGIEPKNAFTEPWVNRLDLRVVQELPIHGKIKAELAFNFINFGSFISKKTFGYVEQTAFNGNDVFRTRTLNATTAYNNATGQIRPTYTADPAGFVIDNLMSRWRIQVEAKLRF